jgi:ribokinase
MSTNDAGRVIVVGSINVDLYVSCRAFPRPGETVTADALTDGFRGKGANQAGAAAV